ncbi:hypothetical protein [Streptomonospora nanhaiensis]|uniref:hypothetical protein n=1 Tax=Streptomonospora nanhaiensis TaxID=1323731 RepID=UPI001C382B8C|nr:hypothetical protein [Streptomonospora nanhaiensis]MBV2365746.1 hypothetical protein [Streptomonospora nanhaiensis]
MLSAGVSWFGVGLAYITRKDIRHSAHESRLNRYTDVLKQALALNSAKWYKTINPFLLAKELFVGKNVHEALKQELAYLQNHYGPTQFNVDRLRKLGLVDHSLDEMLLNPDAKIEVRTRPNTPFRQRKNTVSEYEARLIERTIRELKDTMVGLGERFNLLEGTSLLLRGVEAPQRNPVQVGFDAVVHGQYPDFEKTWGPVLADYFNSPEDIVKAVGMLTELERAKVAQMAKDGRAMSWLAARRLKQLVDRHTRPTDRATLEKAGLPPQENHGRRRGRH